MKGVTGPPVTFRKLIRWGKLKKVMDTSLSLKIKNRWSSGGKYQAMDYQEKKKECKNNVRLDLKWEINGSEPKKTKNKIVIHFVVFFWIICVSVFLCN